MYIENPIFHHLKWNYREMWIKPIKEWSKWIDCISRKYGRSPKNNQHYHWFRNDWKSTNQNQKLIYMIMTHKLWVIHLNLSLLSARFFNNVILWFTRQKWSINYRGRQYFSQAKNPTGSIIFKTGSETFEGFLAEWIILGDSDSTWQC